MKQFVTDRYGNEIYWTTERWEHIVSVHDEMIDYGDRFISVLQTGKRKQDPLKMNVYKYSLPYDDLADQNNVLIVVVKFEKYENGGANNFVLTAYQSKVKK